MPDSNDTLVTLCARETRILAEIDSLQKEFTRAMEGQKAQLQFTRERIAMFHGDLDLAKVDLARSILYLSGSYTGGGDRRESVVKDAVYYFANSIKPPHCYYGLREGYYGTKQYDAWYGQREDHAYGYGPRHGSTIFAVGLKDTKADLTEEQREAAIYYLLNIERIEKAQAEAKAA